MEEIAEVYARSLFEVAEQLGKLDVIREQLAAFAEALAGDQQLQVFFFSPYFTVEEQKEGLGRMLEDADPNFVNFLEALIEHRRMPVIFRIRTEFEALRDKSRQLLAVKLTSDTELDPELVASLGRRIGEQTGSEVTLSSEVDPSVIGGIVLRVGNFILDASIRARLEQLRREVAQA